METKEVRRLADVVMVEKSKRERIKLRSNSLPRLFGGVLVICCNLDFKNEIKITPFLRDFCIRTTANATKTTSLWDFKKVASRRSYGRKGIKWIYKNRVAMMFCKLAYKDNQMKKCYQNTVPMGLMFAKILSMLPEHRPYGTVKKSQ